MSRGNKIRVLIAKAGLDGHDRGAKVISYALRDEGMEVIFAGLRQTPERIVSAAIEEDVDVIGISSMSGAHKTVIPRIMTMLRERGADDIIVLCGGIIPKRDYPALLEAGVTAIFGPGSSVKKIAECIKSCHEDRPAAQDPNFTGYKE